MPKFVTQETKKLKKITKLFSVLPNKTMSIKKNISTMLQCHKNYNKDDDRT